MPLRIYHSHHPTKLGVIVVPLTDNCSRTVTRTNKANDRDHKGLADGTASPTEHLPRFFAKSGHADVDPKKVKKDGCGRGNW